MSSGSDVSIVVQGPVHGQPGDPPDRQLTRRVLQSARAVWPGAELILSTWANTPVEGLDCDRVVFSNDPGAITLNEGAQRHVFSNLNRQLTSTQAGLACATRRFALKLRSDCLLTRPIDFTLLDQPGRHPRWSVLEKRVVALTVFTRHPFHRPVLFHLSDLFHAGLTSDLRRLWNLPLVVEPGHTRTIDPSRRPSVDVFPEWEILVRCVPEQYLAEQLARRLEPSLLLRHYSDGSIPALFLWLRLLANNFTIVHHRELGLRLPERLHRQCRDWDLLNPTAQEWPWLSLWTRDRVPLLARTCLALCYCRQRWAYTRPGLVRFAMRALLLGPLRLNEAFTVTPS